MLQLVKYGTTTLAQRDLFMRPTDIQPHLYGSQLVEKQNDVVSRFSKLTPLQPEVFPSEPLNYRMRAEFRIWHDGDEMYHVMFDSHTKQQYRVDHFPPGATVINQAMSALMKLIKPNDILRRKLYQIDYLTGLSGELLISLIYRRQLDASWIEEAKLLKQSLAQLFNVNIIGRARKQKLLLDRDYIIESLPVNERTYTFKHIENSFTQPNAMVNCKMIEWAKSAVGDNRDDLLELYCGAGNFSLPLAANFRRVLATEIAKSSVQAAQFNIAQNQINNVDIIQMSSEELSAYIATGEYAKKLKHLSWTDFECNTVLVDPPRSGLDEDTLDLVQQFKRIVYISCNPETLLNNAKQLATTHQITHFALFDQFPYTHHAEIGMVFGAS